MIDRPDLQDILLDECRKLKPDFIVNGAGVSGYATTPDGVRVSVASATRATELRTTAADPERSLSPGDSSYALDLPGDLPGAANLTRGTSTRAAVASRHADALHVSAADLSPSFSVEAVGNDGALAVSCGGGREIELSVHVAAATTKSHLHHHLEMNSTEVTLRNRFVLRNRTGAPLLWMQPFGLQ